MDWKGWDRLFWLLFFLALGLLVGRKAHWTDRWEKLPTTLSTIGLVFLLTVMGAQIGGNPELLQQIGLLGGQAAILAAAAVVGSVLLVHILDLCWWRRKDGDL